MLTGKSMDEKLIIDSGYSSTKVYYGKLQKKYPSNISFSTNTGIVIGDRNNVYNFEGQQYTVGESSIDGESFSTIDFSHKLKFDPLIIKHVRDILNIPDSEVPNLVLSLSLVDYSKKDQYSKRCSEFKIDDSVIRNHVQLVPQGVGCYYDFVHNQNNNEHPDSTYVLDIGYNTINALYFRNGKVMPDKSKGYPNHGVNSIIRPFAAILEHKYNIQFSEHNASMIFSTETFKFKGEPQDEWIADQIYNLKLQFIQKLFNSVLVQDRQLLTTSDVVLFAGGGSYFLKDVELNKNCQLVNSPFEFSNVRGMHYLTED